jgi:glucose 1-dehydrogenase
MFSPMVKQLGTIDILVNNAGLQRGAPWNMTPAQWNMVISVNLTEFLGARTAIVEFPRRWFVPKCRPALARSFV